MKRSLLSVSTLLILLSGFMLFNTSSARAASVMSSCVNSNGTTTLQGNIQGANYTIMVPSNWNGTLRLYSHGYVSPFSPLLNPAPGGNIRPGKYGVRHLPDAALTVAGAFDDIDF